MIFDFRFREIDSTADIKKLIDFIRQQHLNYPDYHSWVQRAEAELYTEYKQAVMAFSDRTLVGNVIYQPHKQIQGVLELKNLRVHPELRRRDFGHFMLRQAETEARNSGRYSLMMIDTRADQKDMLALLIFSGFREIGRTSLYDSGSEDVMLAKPLSRDGNLIQIASPQ